MPTRFRDVMLGRTGGAMLEAARLIWRLDAHGAVRDHRAGRRQRLAGALLATPDRDRGRERAADLRLGLSAGG